MAKKKINKVAPRDNNLQLVPITLANGINALVASPTACEGKGQTCVCLTVKNKMVNSTDFMGAKLILQHAPRAPQGFATNSMDWKPVVWEDGTNVIFSGPSPDSAVLPMCGQLLRVLFDPGDTQMMVADVEAFLR
jgi:hypothetical protein